MIVKTIQIYTNRISADLQPYLTKLFQYNSQRGITYHYDITPVNITGYKSIYTNISSGMGYILTGAENLVPQNNHDITMFIFDLGEWKSPWWNPFPLRSDTPRCDCILVNGKPFINLGYYEGDLNGFQINLLHESMHAPAKIFGCVDQMDTYDQNNNPESLTGNFAKQWAIFKPYLNLPITVSTPNHSILTRNKSDTKETLGVQTFYRNGQSMTVYTVELPWLNNQHDISCIPTGTYLCKWTPFHDTFHYELQNVPNRTGIFEHNGNYYHDSLGCIIIGSKPVDINHDGELDVPNSVITLTAVETFMNKEDFTLTIV